jgi:hydrogenase-4 component B
VVLTLLAILVAALVALAAVSAFVPRSVLRLATAGLGGVAILLVLAALFGIDNGSTVELPLGPAGVAMRLALDPLGAGLLLLVLLILAPCTLVADSAVAAARPPGLLAAVLLSVLAADPFTLLLGLLLLGIAGWAPTRYAIGLTIFGLVCVMAALALAAPHAVVWLDCDFIAMRAAPPEGARAAMVLFLILLGMASQLGLPGSVAMPATTTVWIYVLIRVLLDLCGPAQPLWWGVPLLSIGVVAAVFGALRATLGTSLHSVLSIGSLHQLGLSMIGIGAALMARAVDLPGVSLIALQAVWLLLASHILCRTLLLLCAAAVEAGAGTRQLDRLGGLIHRMPITATCTVVGLLGIGMLPPGVGFAGFWLLFQSLLAVARIGGLALQLLIAVVAALAALSIGLGAFAAVRLFGVAFLGRPRTPRTAVAEEAPKPLRMVLLGAAALTALLGLLPTLALLPVAQALGRLANGGTDAFGFDLSLRPGADASGYAPLALVVLLVIAGCAVFWLLRRSGSQALRRETAWSGGFAPPPAWLPFGDPATQFGPASFAEPLRQVMPAWFVPRELGSAALRARCAHARDRFLHAAVSAGHADAAGLIAAMLLVLALALASWLALS